MDDSTKLWNKVIKFTLRDPGNLLPGDVRIYDQPLVGFADARDDLFLEFTQGQIVGSMFRLPHQWLSGALTVISYFLPFTEHVRSSNYSTGLASVEWLHARFRGEKFNNRLRRYLVQKLYRLGGRAVAPAIEKEMVIDYHSFCSSWSERHVAYAAGLGSFGLNRSLITAKGLAGRFGSVITDLQFPSTPRNGNNPFKNCLFLANQSCGVCIEHCPAGAITEKGKDKSVCYQYMFLEDRMRVLREKYGYEHSICGKCQVNIPCEDSIP